MGMGVFSDVAEGTIDAFLQDGIVHVEKDRWIRTYTKEDIYTLLKIFMFLRYNQVIMSCQDPLKWQPEL